MSMSSITSASQELGSPPRVREELGGLEGRHIGTIGSGRHQAELALVGTHEMYIVASDDLDNAPLIP